MLHLWLQTILSTCFFQDIPCGFQPLGLSGTYLPTGTENIEAGIWHNYQLSVAQTHFSLKLQRQLIFSKGILKLS